MTVSQDRRGMLSHELSRLRRLAADVRCQGNDGFVINGARAQLNVGIEELEAETKAALQELQAIREDAFGPSPEAKAA